MATNKRYHSFDEIQRDLAILRLQREIAKESLKLNFARVKNRLYPVQLLWSTSGILKSFVWAMAAKVIGRFLQKSRSKEVLDD